MASYAPLPPPPRPARMLSRHRGRRPAIHRLLLLAVTGTLVASSLAVLDPAGSARLLAESSQEPLLEVALAALHLVATATVGWILLSAILAVAAWTSAAPPLTALARRAAPPMLRGLIERSLGGVVAGAVLFTATPAVATPAVVGPAAGPTVPAPSVAAPAPLPPPGIVPPAVAATPPGSLDTPTAPDRAGPSPDAGAREAGSGGGTGTVGRSGPTTEDENGGVSAEATTPAGTAAVEDSWTVRPGDSLWSIAVAQLERADGAVPSAGQVAAYWARIVDANRDGLRSGQPDIIRPGEVIRLPPIAPTT